MLTLADRRIPRAMAVLATLLLAPAVVADASDDAGVRTVIGPRNPLLANGAERLIAGDIEEGIRLTRLGLDVASGSREKVAGLSNLCAGYLRLRQPEIALDYCNEALAVNDRYWRAFCNRALVHLAQGRFDDAANDLDAAESIAPSARSVQLARAEWRDATDPVNPEIVIDDRRDTGRSSDPD